MSNGENSINPSLLPVTEKQKPENLAEVIKEKAPDVLEAIPADKQARLASVRIEKHEFSMRASPLPDPEELAAYNQIIPQGADRILKMAENQSAHRIEIEKIAVSSQQRQGFCGQLFGLIIGLAGLGFATYAAVNGQPWFGSIIGGATLVSLVSAFLYSRHAQKRELAEKKPQVQPAQIPQNRKKKNRNR